MTNRKTLHILSAICILAALCLYAIPADAQRKQKAKAAQKPAKPVEEDMSEWTDNPICRTMIIDSIVVDKDDAVSHIPLPAYCGRFFIDRKKATAPDTSEDGEPRPSARLAKDGLLIYENEMGDQRLYTAPADTSGTKLFRQILLGDDWSKGEEVTINGSCYDIANAYPTPDGQALYFSARNSEDGDGRHFSLYTTTFDAETNSYLAPQRMPYPFNSSADDLLFIDDDTDNISWLVTTRHQPDGKVCIYTMQTKQPWEFYDAEETDPQKLKRLATIASIAETWTSDAQRDEALATLRQLKESGNETGASTGKMRFVVNDRTVYTSPSQFSSQESRDLYAQLQAKKNEETDTMRQLDSYRRLYHNSSEENRQRLAETIIDAEKALKALSEETRGIADRLRSMELGAL